MSIQLTGYNSNSTSALGTTVSTSVAYGGTNGVTIACLVTDTGTPTVTMTVGGNAMTLITTVNIGVFIMKLYYFVSGSTSGVGTITATTGTNVNAMTLHGASFSNVLQTGQPDVFSAVSGSSSLTTYNISTTLATTFDSDVVIAFSAWNAVGLTSGVAGAGYVELQRTNPRSNWWAISEVNSDGTSQPPPITPPQTVTPSYNWNANSTSGVATLLGALALKRASSVYNATGSSSIMNSASRLTSVAVGTIPTLPPKITIRNATYPFSAINNTIEYIKTSYLGTVLPVLNNEKSDPVYFRIYNDFDGIQKVADALNIVVTTWDANSTSASMAVASQQWLHIRQSGFGEGSSGGSLLTAFPGLDAAVGGTNIYTLSNASNGAPDVSEIRSASNYPGAGFVELETYILPSVGSVGQVNVFVISLTYEYVI